MKNEHVLCVLRSELVKHFDLKAEHWKIQISQFDDIPFSFIPRNEAEHDISHKQLIPYTLVLNEFNQVLTYQRRGSEKRLAGLNSAGIGGHVNEDDKTDNLYGSLINGLKRELNEEIGIAANPDQFRLLGMINEEKTEVGHSHTGVVFCLHVNHNELIMNEEVGIYKWMNLEEIQDNKFEFWSLLSLGLLTATEII